MDLLEGFFEGSHYKPNPNAKAQRTQRTAKEIDKNQMQLQQR
jgi:hypothetical protein